MSEFLLFNYYVGKVGRKDDVEVLYMRLDFEFGVMNNYPILVLSKKEGMESFAVGIC